ncbi:MAG: polyphosphate kinase 2 [Chloroflexi bacterium]|nr:polyphosphate kinase 2 [Chloroflexota bacterium]
MTNLSTLEVAPSPPFPTEGIPLEVISKVEAALPGQIISDTYPYPTKLSTKKYESEKAKLQIELLKMQKWVKETGQRMVLLFEGRDAAGKGGTIQRFMEHLNPRGASIVALPAPSDRERGQWYFQRYVEHLPSKGEMVFFDRSWYNRAVVEPVMGFCTPAETLRFLRDTVMFEEMLINEGLQIFKFWFSVSREEQLRRVMSRAKDELKQWKVSDVDVRSLPRWDDYTEAKKAMFAATDTKASPWVVVKSDDKMRARLACMRYVLRSVRTDNDVEISVAKPDPKLIGPAEKLYAKGEIW